VRLIEDFVQIKAVVINQDLEVKAEAHVHFDSMLPEYRFLPFFHNRAQCLWNLNGLLRFWFRFWKSSVPVPVPVPYQDVFQQFFNAESCLFNDRNSIISPESWPLIFTFFDLKKFHFTLFPVPNPASEPEP
jgi:hypothetical protein